MKKLIFILMLGICFTQTDDVDNNKSLPNISDKNNSFAKGLLTNKIPSLIQYTHDYKLSDNYAIFGALGLWSWDLWDLFDSGHPLAGLGIAWQSNYNANGMMIVGSVVYMGDTIRNLSLSYQWRLGKSSNFVSLGGSYVYYSESLEDGSPQHDPMPVISFDRRF